MRTLIEVIDDYDRDQRIYISKLERDIADLKKQNSELLDLTLAGVREREGLMLKAILAGAFDRKDATVTP
jgi:hypothetical protein